MLINEWLFAVGWRPVLMRETPDAAGSGGAAPAGGAAGGESGADAGPSAGDESAELASDAQAGAHAGDTGDDDDEFDALEPDQTARLEADPEGRRVLRTNKKLTKFAKFARPVMQAMRQLGIDPRQPNALADLIHKARSFDNFERAAADNPRLRAILHGGADDGAAGGRQPDRRAAALPEDDPFQFDEASLPWDRNDPGARALVDHLRGSAQTIHGLRMDLNRIVNALRAHASDNATRWKQYDSDRARHDGEQGRSVVDTAAQKITDPELQEEFRYAVYGRLQAAKAQGKRLSVADAVNLVVKRFTKTGQMSSRDAVRVAASQQQTAERNRSLPRPASMVGGAPAAANVRRDDETIWDINRRALGKRYVGSR